MASGGGRIGRGGGRRMGASVPKSPAQVHDDAVANQRRVGHVLPPFQYKLPKDGKTGVYFFWDINTTPLHPNCDVGNLAKSLKSALQNCNEEYTIMEDEICTGYGDLRGFTAEQFSKLTSLGFKLRHLVTRSLGECETGCGAKVPPARVPADSAEKRDQPEAMIPMSMYTYAALYELKHNQKSHICVMSGDPDFASTIAGLVSRDHIVFAAVPQPSDGILRERSIEAWYWNKMQEGKKPIEKKLKKKM